MCSVLCGLSPSASLWCGFSRARLPLPEKYPKLLKRKVSGFRTSNRWGCCFLDLGFHRLALHPTTPYNLVFPPGYISHSPGLEHLCSSKNIFPRVFCDLLFLWLCRFAPAAKRLSVTIVFRLRVRTILCVFDLEWQFGEIFGNNFWVTFWVNFWERFRPFVEVCDCVSWLVMATSAPANATTDLLSMVS